FASRCYFCHSAKATQVQGGLRLDTPAAIRQGGNSGPVIQPGEPEKSLLLRAVRYQDKELKMPPGKALPAETVADIESWIRGGAALPAEAATAAPVSSGRTFWAFERPKESPVPTIRMADWPANEIDHFILAKLEQKGLRPSPPADKRTLIRRVTYDLTGLPATQAEIEAFAADRSPAAYARLVDRLLASPRYGERWARYWLDVARYSDARNVGERFPWSYTYRDWVIRAFNEDLPYDRFVELQLAADVLPGKRDVRDLAALGFLSLGRDFPKTFPETVDDRIDVVTRGFLGLTVACARCHDHKYDPIPTKDYYSLYSIFSNIREPRELPLVAASTAARPELDRVWQPRLQHIREVDAEYRRKRCAEMVSFFKTQIADYLVATRDSRNLSNTEIEELVKDRQLNLHMLSRWRSYLAESRARKEPVFQIWHALADLPDAEFATKAGPVLKGQTGVNPRVAAEFHQHPPASLREAANLYAAVLLKYDRPETLASAEEEPLRLALRSPQAPVNVPVEEFELIYTEGDGNNTRGFERRYEAMRASYAYAGASPRAMVLEDVPSPQPVHVFIRGNPNNPGVETPPHFLSCLAGPEPAVFRKGSGRLELAQAVASPANPLTARVMVNRVWMHHFGVGLVRTPSDFGVRGDAPTHPELLDYLAVRFMQSGWSIKSLHRLILLSATYRQSSQDNPESRQIDPENQLLWRMNRQRLDIEALRDSLLAVSGRLDLTAGGPPYSLTGLPTVPRRTVYGFIERGRVPGFLSNFDFASPDQHAPLRYNTTVPQQALFLLNSPFVAEQARHLAHRPEVERLSDAQQRIGEMYRIVFGRAPSSHEVELGKRFLASAASSQPAAAPQAAWQYGYGEFDAATGRVKSFAPFRYFVDDSWQGASMLPARGSGSAALRPNGGTPGDDAHHAVIRRWVSPVSGKVSIEGMLRHNQDALGTGDGVRARIVSSRLGELATWVVAGSTAETKLGGIAVEKGDTLDFLVDGRSDVENDAFVWAPALRLQGSETRWSATADFRGPADEPLSPWERYAEVLLQTNEFAFVD
ncbi:MAG TPA: PSD1 and planctomycete cytochrome C domain-containing protein, partial [Bryobacteraceae bacterium]|nr:PSD1 and planctomycete cytochrome C domain-containing protein [Bryobacteraceae bacterium]